MAKITGNRFTTTGYTANNGDVYKIRIENQSSSAQPTADNGTATTRTGRALVGGSRRRAGLHARGLRLVRTTGSPPNVVSYRTFFPVLLPSDWQNTADNATITINGVQWTVESHVPEVIR